MAGSKSVVIAALIANAAIAILKFVGYLLTGSAAMLSETYHSISDTGNQIFLLIGLRFSDRSADRRHPFGYGKSQFFYSFLVSVLLFGIAGWESAKHGWNQLTGAAHAESAGETVHLLFFTYTPPAWLDPVMVNYAILLGAFVFEGWALFKARREMRHQMDRNDWESYREAFRKTSDVTTLTALTEDTVAVSGIGIALVGITLEQLTDNAVFDQVSALLIGLLLMVFAVALAWENQRLLLGESLEKATEDDLRAIISSQTGVEAIVDFRTVYFGPEQILLTADIQFEDGLTTDEIDERITAMENSLQDAEDSIQKIYIEPEV